MTKKRWFSPSPPMVRKKEKKESHLPVQNSMLFAPHNVWVKIIKKEKEKEEIKKEFENIHYQTKISLYNNNKKIKIEKEEQENFYSPSQSQSSKDLSAELKKTIKEHMNDFLF